MADETGEDLSSSPYTNPLTSLYHRTHSSLTSLPSTTYSPPKDQLAHSRAVSAASALHHLPSKPHVRRKPLPPPQKQQQQHSSYLPSDIDDKEHPLETTSITHHASPPIYPITTSNPQSHLDSPSSPPGTFAVRDLDRYPRGTTPVPPRHSQEQDDDAVTPTEHSLPKIIPVVVPDTTHHHSQTKLSHVRLASDPAVSSPGRSTFFPSTTANPAATPAHARSATMSFASSSKSPNLSLDVADYSSTHPSDDSLASSAKPKSPSKFGAFFGWKSSSSPGPNSPATSFTDRTTSPIPSPVSPYPAHDSENPFSLADYHYDDTTTIDKGGPLIHHTDSGLPPSPTDNTGAAALPIKFDEMEDELRQISSELASSIRREMDLEDLVEKLQAEVAAQPGGGAAGRRTSDYFSDSGNSSVRAPGDAETKQEEMEKTQRRMEQERAQLRLDLTQKVQEERLRRKDLELHVHDLQEKVQRVDLAQLKSSDATGRVKELEASLEDVKRKLIEERQIKENFEDLLGALQGQIEEHKNERDNLKDEIVPQLRARVEGLESEAAEFQRLTYENTRMQQELQTLKNENNALVSARRIQNDLHQQGGRIGSIAEDDGIRQGLSRSNSTARSSLTGKRGAGMTLGRSNSVTQKDRESRDSLAERVKDIEAQRDALHSALKNLLDRQDFANRENAKRIKMLEMERDRALSGSPQRMGYDREVSHLREEINTLRRRADEALEQKWQCEKGLAGIKMDLDRAEQETSALRVLLQEHDILVPELPVTTSGPEIRLNGVATSASLEKAYKDLQATNARSLARIKELERGGAGGASTSQTLADLHRSKTEAEAQRDTAVAQADEYRLQAEAYRASNATQLSEEQNLAEQLRASASRVEELASQVQRQLASNEHLRKRLAEAIGRGEREQKASALRITDMQRRLKGMEDAVLAAQQASEEKVAEHEEEVRALKESHSLQLQRMKNGVKATTPSRKGAGASPLFTGRQAPEIKTTSSGEGMSMAEATRTEELEGRVKELEKALRTADREMEEVVSRMNKAQIEVMELQTERDEAMRTTRRLHGAIEGERGRVVALMA